MGDMLDDGEKHRGEENPKQGHTDHAAEDGGAQGLTHFGPGPFGQH